MNKKHLSGIFWGLFLICAAVFVIVGSLGYFGGINVWTCVFTALLVAWLTSSIVKLEFGGIFFSLAFAAILFDEELGITELTPVPVLLAAALFTAGFSMIFRKRKNSKEFENYSGFTNGPVDAEENVTAGDMGDETYKCHVAFSSTVKYITSQNLRMADLENSFGSLVVYFDNARLCNGNAFVKVENNFGKTTLYIPRIWSVNIATDKAFASIDEVGVATGESGVNLMINASCAFGQIEIIYV